MPFPLFLMLATQVAMRIWSPLALFDEPRRPPEPK